MAKYKVGDKVRIREDLEIDECIGSAYVTSEMMEYLGRDATIEKITGLRLDQYQLNVDDHKWGWTDGMLEEVAPKKKSETSKTNDGKVTCVKTINVSIPIELLNKWEEIKAVYDSNLTEYVRKLIRRDMDSNYDDYKRQAKMIENPDLEEEVSDDRKLYEAIIDVLAEKYPIETEEEVKWLLSMPIGILLRELKGDAVGK